MLQTLHFLTDSSKIAVVTFNVLLLNGFVDVFRKYEACYLIQIMKLNHNQFNLFVACLGFEQLYLDGFVYVIWKYEECYLQGRIKVCWAPGQSNVMVPPPLPTRLIPQN